MDTLVGPYKEKGIDILASAFTASAHLTNTDVVEKLTNPQYASEVPEAERDTYESLSNELNNSKHGAEYLINAAAGIVVGGIGGVAKGKGEEKITDNPQSSSQELSTIHADAGSKGNWDPVLNKTIQPNTRYELSNGHTYMTDNIGRVNQVDGELKLTTMDRNTYQQNCADKCVNATGDDGGHLIASSLGGAGNKINLVPQASTLNRGDWKAMERQLANELKAGKAVSVKIDVSYPNSSSGRPNEFNVTAVIDGVKKTWEFDQ